MLTEADRQRVIRRTEKWFVRQGVPHLIDDYRFSAHVLPRMLPFLGAVVVASIAWFVPFPVVSPALQTAAWGITVAAVAVILRARRRLWRLSPRAAALILIAYASAPLLIPLALVAIYERARAAQLLGDPDGGLPTILGEAVLALLAAFAVIFVVAWLATTFGIVPLGLRAAGHALSDMRQSLRLQGLALPTLLFVTLFLFFSSELWLLMNRLAWWRLWLVLLTFAAVTILATSSRLRREIDRVEQDLSPARLAAACASTPLADHAPATVDAPAPLTKRQVGNLLLVLATRQLVQAAVVGLGLFGFFVLLGLIIVDEETARAWTVGEPQHSVWVPFIPVALFRSATLLAGFGSMYFAITAMTEEGYRREFFDNVIEDVERTLTVRAVYLSLRADAAST
jgi:hypothetical protein